MNQTLNSIVVQERCQRMLETKNVPVRRAKRLSFALTAALSLVLMAAVAVAVVRIFRKRRRKAKKADDKPEKPC